MRRLLLLLPVALLLGLGAGAGANPIPAASPHWFATPPIAPQYLPIGLTFWNTTVDTVFVSDTAPWWIEDAGGARVYTPPLHFFVVVPVPPGGMLLYHWGQTNDAGAQVPPGTYFAKIDWGDASNPNLYVETARILIRGDVGWIADPHVVPPQASVTLMVNDGSPDSLRFADDMPWFVTNSTGMVVYDPVPTSGPFTLEPGGSWSWTWEPAVGITPGSYLAVLQFTSRLATGPVARELRAQIEVHSPSGDVVWAVRPMVQATRTAVALELTNATANSIWIPRWPSYWIDDDAGNRVYSPVALQAFYEIPPAASVAWPWLERDTQGQPVGPGWYRAWTEYTHTGGPPYAQKSYRFLLVGPPNSAPATCAFVRSTDDDNVYASGENVHFRFTNCAPDTVGMHCSYIWWIGAWTGLPVYANEFCLMNLPLFAPQDSFAFHWDTRDQTGNPVPPGMYQGYVTFTDKRFATNYVVASNHVYVGSISTAIAPPSILRLQATPNPFNPRLEIAFGLDAAARVDLQVFDVAGRRIRTLLAGKTAPAGWNRVVWAGESDAGRAQPSGVYLVRLATPWEVRTTRAVLIE